MFCMYAVTARKFGVLQILFLPLGRGQIRQDLCVCCSYDNGVTGGVVAMPGFLEQFFPEVGERVKARARSEEGKERIVIQLYTSCNPAQGF